MRIRVFTVASILIFPCLGVAHSAEQADNHQAVANSSNAPSHQTSFVSDNAPQHHQADAQQSPEEGQERVGPDGMTMAERLNYRLTITLCIIGALQCLVYFGQWHLMRITSKRELRAYLCVINSTRDAPHLKTGEMSGYPKHHSIFIKNVGRTPAYSVAGSCDWRCIAGAKSHWPDKEPFLFSEPSDRGSTAIMGSDQILESRSELDNRPDGTTFEEALNRAIKGEACIFIYGVTRYTDIYGKRRYTRHCDVLRAGVVAGTCDLTTYDQHNEAD